MRILIFILLIISSAVYAGSFAPMVEDFSATSKEFVAAIKPSFTVKNIHRGSDDGNFASTSDAGILTLQLNDIPEQNQGYIFEIVDGVFEDKLFYETPVTPTEFAENKGSFTFIWLDGSSEEQEAFNIKIKIVAISISGDKSDAQYLEVSHEGVKKPWWNLW